MEHDWCGRCNRRLKSVKSRKIGFGPTCHRKEIASEALAQQAKEKEKAALLEQDDPNQVVFNF